MGSKQSAENIMDNNVIRVLSGILLTVLFSIFLVITLYSNTFVNSVSNKEKIKEWVSDEEVQYELVTYIVEKSVPPDVLAIAERIAGEERVDNIIRSDIVTENVEKLSTLIVDTLFSWLIGEIEEPNVTVEQKVLTEPLIDLINDNLGIIGEILDLGDKIDGSKEITLLALDETRLTSIQKVYQGIENIPKVSLFLTILFGGMIFFSTGSWRRGSLLLGIGFILSGVLLFLASNRTELELASFFTKIPLPGIQLPSIESLPRFAQLLLIRAWEDIALTTSQYTKYLIGIGVILSTISQLAIRDREEKEYEIEDSEDSVTYEGESSFYDEESREIEEEE